MLRIKLTKIAILVYIKRGQIVSMVDGPTVPFFIRTCKLLMQSNRQFEKNITSHPHAHNFHRVNGHIFCILLGLFYVASVNFIPTNVFTAEHGGCIHLAAHLVYIIVVIVCFRARKKHTHTSIIWILLARDSLIKTKKKRPRSY